MEQINSPVLQSLAASLDDIEAARIAAENRVRSLTGEWTDDQGVVHGYGLGQFAQEVQRMDAIVTGMKSLEHVIELQLNREMRKHPMYGWVKRSQGVGERQSARLLAALVDPYVNGLHDRPRTISELWEYSGYGEVHRRTKGVKSNWNPEVKKRLYLIAVSIVKQTGGTYRGVYDEARSRYADAVHNIECIRCGPSGHPAPVGSPLNPGHQHARALRKVSKEVLRDLWIEARAYHEQEQQEAA